VQVFLIAAYFTRISSIIGADGKSMIARIGSFLILLGLALLVVFIGSFLAKEINGNYLLLSLATLFIGFLFRRNRPVNDSGRFGTIRRARERSRQSREERKNDKQKK
jgi:hypothetical protein